MYQSKLAQFVAAGINQSLVNASIEAQANAGRVPAFAVDIAHNLGFELPAKPVALILALNAAENAKPFNTKKGYQILIELFAMAQAIVDSGKVKNLPALTLPEWATNEARENEVAKKTAKKTEKKSESKKSEVAPAVNIVTLETVKNQIHLLPDNEKQELLAFIAESLGYEMAIS
jgi:hypothetical protein